MTNIQGLVTFPSRWLDHGMKAIDWRNGSFGSQLNVQLSWWSHCSRDLRLVPWHQQFRHRGQLSWSHFCAVIKCPGAGQLQGERELILVAVPLQSVTVGRQCRNLKSLVTSKIGSRGNGRILAYCSVCFLYSYTIQNPNPRNAAPTFSLGLHPSTK